MIRQQKFWTWPAFALLAWVALGDSSAKAQGVIQVCATVPELGSLVRTIGGDQVSVTVFAKGTEDAHFVEARPSYMRDLSQAELLVQMGMSLEVGWIPPLIKGARNTRLTGEGILDASKAIKPLGLHSGELDRSMGDVHPDGNPHYLSDPLNGLRVARLIRDKLSEMRPDAAQGFRDRYIEFSKKIAVGLVGEELAKKYPPSDVEKLALLHEYGKLEKFLKEQKQDALLGGWLGAMMPYYGTKVVDDHDMWPYFAQRFGLKVVGHLEPIPGVAPTTTHLQTVVRLVQNEKVKAILANPYFNPRHAQFVAGATSAKVVEIAHQAGARPGTEDYIAFVDYNVRQLATAFREGK